MILLIFLLITVIVFYSNLKSKEQDKQEMAVQKNVEIVVPLKYISTFWRKLEITLINCENNLQLKWSDKGILAAGTAANQEPKLKITDTKLDVPVVTLSNQDNVKLLKQLESGFKRTINWNKCHSTTTNLA